MQHPMHPILYPRLYSAEHTFIYVVPALGVIPSEAVPFVGHELTLICAAVRVGQVTDSVLLTVQKHAYNWV